MKKTGCRKSRDRLPLNKENSKGSGT
jgi:hypothetical protein